MANGFVRPVSYHVKCNRSPSGSSGASSRTSPLLRAASDCTTSSDSPVAAAIGRISADALDLTLERLTDEFCDLVHGSLGDRPLDDVRLDGRVRRGAEAPV